MSQIQLHKSVSEELAGLRLDQALAKLFPQFSRSRLQQWIKDGYVYINQKPVYKSREKVYPGQIIEIVATLEDQDEWQPEPIPLDIVFEDEDILLLNKPSGLVTHPGAGNPKSTLVNALLHYDPLLQKIPRAGLIHRLDKNTSGLLLVARTLSSHHLLIQQMQRRKIVRIYDAIVTGLIQSAGTIDMPIGRHPIHRTKMAVVNIGGKPAITHYRLIEKFKAHSYVEVQLETGRTHQIRVHMAYINHPILGDPLYGRRAISLRDSSLNQLIQSLNRQLLHAKKISFQHPITGNIVSFQTPLPADFQTLLDALRLD